MRQGQAVFVDSGAWIALALSRDPLHAQAREQWELLHGAGAKLHTSVPVVIETFTFLDRNANRDVADGLLRFRYEFLSNRAWPAGSSKIRGWCRRSAPDAKPCLPSPSARLHDSADACRRNPQSDRERIDRHPQRLEKFLVQHLAGMGGHPVGGGNGFSGSRRFRHRRGPSSVQVKQMRH